MRIVSLVPHATELLFALGLGDDVVGVTHECDHPVQATRLPRLTRDELAPGLDAAAIDAAVRERTQAGEAIYGLDEKLLAELEPDLIVTQELCPVCAVSYDEVIAVAGRIKSCPKVVALDPKTFGETMGDVRTIAQATGTKAAGLDLIARQRERVDRVKIAVKDEPRVTVAALEWLDPVFIAGHWTPQLIELAGGIDVLGFAGEPSAQLTWEAVAAAAPDVIIVMPCGYDAPRALQEARAHAADLAATGAAADRRGRRIRHVLAARPAARRRARDTGPHSPSGRGARRAQPGAGIALMAVALQVHEVVKGFGGRTILQGASLQVADDARIGLVGPNGAGKSTLLRMFAGLDVPDAGAITTRKGAVVRFLPQLVTGDDRTVRQTLHAARPDHAARIAELADVEARLTDPALAGDLRRMTRLLERQEALVTALAADDVEGEGIRHLRDLGLDESLLDRPTSRLSGGQAKLVALAACLVGRPDVLLLDEPEAHLDIRRRRRLEELLDELPGAVVMVSHDRYLLDETVREIAELEGVAASGRGRATTPPTRSRASSSSSSSSRRT